MMGFSTVQVEIFPEVEMRTKPGMENNIGGKILAALMGVTDAIVFAASRPRPEVYSSMNVFYKPDIPGSYQAVTGAIYAQKEREAGIDISPNDGIGIGR